jgi:serine/threonine-protein kinase
MDSARWDQIVAIFSDAAERPESERRAFLDAACGDDAELMAAVRTMLKSDGRGAPLLDRGLPEVAYRMVGAPVETLPFQEVGPYRLIRILGEGGMGVVGLAEREDTGRPVAIKFLLHAEMSSARRERFAREIKTLAKLKHPFIARLYDAGTLADGTPWFVMEYVEGKRFTDYCRQRERPVEEQLRLFRSVCEAVQYAHGQAVIHRDLKPSNILVERDGTPRLLDFGIARELNDPNEPGEPGDGLGSSVRFYSEGYAAPEWKRGGSVGAYTDVYSLGVILYETLTGGRPSGNPAEKPSAVAHVRLSKRNWKDLDALCLKALAYDVAERYASVEALIRDIDHYLKEEPLEARPGSVQYRLGKFVRRNRRPVLAVCLVFTLVVGLVIFFTVRLARARNAALAEAARTKRFERFMLNLFRGGGDAPPSTEMPAIALLDRGLKEAASLHADPETQADLYETLGSMYEVLGNYPKADALLRASLDKIKAALGPDDPKVAESLLQLAVLRGDQAQYKEAERLARLGLDVASRHSSLDSIPVLQAKVALARVLIQSSSYDKVAALLDPIVRVQPANEEGRFILKDSLTADGVANYYLGRYEAAESLDRRALALDRQLFDKGHPQTGTDLMNLATVKTTLAEYAEAESLYREALGIIESWYGPDQPDTAACLSILAHTLALEGKNTEAETLARRALRIQEQTYGAVHPYVAYSLGTLGKLATKRGDLAAAKQDLTRAIEIDRTLFGEGSHFTAASMVDLTEVYMKEGQNARAEQMLREAVNVLIAKFPPGDAHIGFAEVSWGRALLRQKRYVEAETQLAAGYQILAKQAHPPSDRMLEVRQDLVAVYDALKEPEKATRFRAEIAAAKSAVARSVSP